jgi:hypothetical protein
MIEMVGPVLARTLYGYWMPLTSRPSRLSAHKNKVYSSPAAMSGYLRQRECSELRAAWSSSQ